MGQSWTPHTEPSHAGIGDILHMRHSEVGKQRTTLAKACDSGVGHLVFISEKYVKNRFLYVSLFLFFSRVQEHREDQEAPA